MIANKTGIQQKPNDVDLTFFIFIFLNFQLPSCEIINMCKI